MISKLSGSACPSACVSCNIVGGMLAEYLETLPASHTAVQRMHL